MENAEAAFRDTSPRGLLRVDVHGTLARHFLLPALQEFLEAYPGIQLHMSEGDRLADLVREGIDCVLRVGSPQDSDMIARRVAVLNEVTVASPDYLAKHGVPMSVDALRDGHCMVGFHSSATGGLLPLQFTVHGEIQSLTLPTTLTVSAAESYVAAAGLGLGLIQVPRYHVDAALASGELVEVLPAHPPSSTPVSLLYPSSRQLSPRVRIFIDWVARQFTAC
ncbi:DNA-binding transcriptional LysR family regulator [Pseudaminobacter salicylatoxidans]|uniref:DNA-binding transcriptional LysR family regulator n=1 Tax=Pseudaminobacter salicylatoxidans TaxID=93369 RepID=A0A316C0V3_PSESE|nr:DNA-binding transcriptional LysR family regulator [Pseudaminobacter salicylatoxidans]